MESNGTASALKSAVRVVLLLTLVISSGSVCLVAVASPSGSMGALTNMAFVLLTAGPLCVVGLLLLRDALNAHVRVAGAGFPVQLGLMALTGLAAIIGLAGALGLLSGPGHPGEAGSMAVVALAGIGVYVVVGASMISSARRADAAASGRR